MRRCIRSTALLLAALVASPGCSASGVAVAPLDLVITNATLHPGPDDPALKRAHIAVRDGIIVAVGTGPPPTGRRTLDAQGRVVTAGLWNSHVHFTDPRIATDAATLMHDMLLRYGFTTVVDTGSLLSDTLTLKQRIGAGAMDGPHIITANGSFVFTNGTPSYLPNFRLPEVARPEEADAAVARFLEAGADGIKIFSGSFQAGADTIYLPPKVIRAISRAAHARGAWVIAHPTDRTGLLNAVDNGVDVLAHVAPPAGPLGAELVARMLKNNIGLIPTLTLWRVELSRVGVPPTQVQAVQRAAVAQLREYSSAGGEVLFGTDVGYIGEFDTGEEFRLMSDAGMGFDDVLKAATTAPAQRFAEASARISVGEPADLVVYRASPQVDVTNFSRVAYTIRAGRVVYSHESVEAD